MVKLMVKDSLFHGQSVLFCARMLYNLDEERGDGVP